MYNKLKSYVAKFNFDDEEFYKQDIDNHNAEKWMRDNIPLIDIPDKTIEEIYYFRWWVFRKHIKSTVDGFVITEFLPPVYLGGKHNTIIAAAGHHISEAKWLRCGKEIIEDYAKFWLEEKSKTYLYSSWIIHSIYEYCLHINDFSFGIKHLNLLINYYEKIEKEHLSDSGLFWSIDNNDAMEYSISGTGEDLKAKKGLRPTLNSYMAANALAISQFAKKSGKEDVADKFYRKHAAIKDKMNEILLDGSFYKAIHIDDLTYPAVEKVSPAQNVKELIGYIPWCFNLAKEGLEGAFSELKSPDGFKSEYGLTTAEKRHSRYLYKTNHECLWNGYIWPFATSQVLYAVKNLLDNYDQSVMTNDDFCDILRTYANSHYRISEDGKTVPWIDEVKDPNTNEWSSRKLLRAWGWREDKGGYERGKDYNHSTFCDIVLGGLLGITIKNEEISLNPKIPDEWNYFSVDNLWINNKSYKIIYDKTGDKYGLSKGLHIIENAL